MKTFLGSLFIFIFFIIIALKKDNLWVPTEKSNRPITTEEFLKKFEKKGGKNGEKPRHY